MDPSLLQLLWVCIGISAQDTLAATIGINLGIHSSGLVRIEENVENATVSLQLSEAVKENDVSVSCNVSDSSPGFSTAIFTKAVAAVGTQLVLINARVVSPGRPSEVQCSGQSLNGGSQYQLSKSSGLPFKLLIVRGPTASICDDPVFVRGYDTGTQQFSVQLSELVKDYPVFVDCSATNLTSGTSNLVLELTRAVVAVGERETKVSFKVLSTGSPVRVSCSAVSSNCPSSSTQSSTLSMSWTTGPGTGFPSLNTLSLFTSMQSMNVSVSSLSASMELSLATTIANPSQASLALPVFSSVANAMQSSLFVDSTAALDRVVSANPSVDMPMVNSPSIMSVAASALITHGNASDERSTVGPSSTTLSAMLSSSIANQTTCQYKTSTSRGPAVSFIIQYPNIFAWPSAEEVVSLTKHVTVLRLDSPLPSGERLELNCRIREIDISQIEVQNFCNQSSGVPLLGSTELTLRNTTLKILEPKLTYQSGEVSKSVAIVFSDVGNATQLALVQTLCCSSSSVKYNGSTVRYLSLLDFKGTKKFGWTSVPESGTSSLTSLAGLDTSCPCDIHEGHCDANCCCDKDCAVVEIDAFICLLGPFGGRPASSSEFRCDVGWPDYEDTYPVICVFTNNSPFVGFFYPYTSPASVSDIVPFEKLRTTDIKSLYSYEEAENRGRTLPNPAGYIYGSSLKTSVGILTLPGVAFGGVCIAEDVRYLVNGINTCYHQAVASVCDQHELNARNFLVPSSLSYPSCPAYPALLLQNTGVQQASVTVEYYCLSDPSPYIIADDGSAGFSNPSLLGNETQRTGASQSRCAFDDGLTLPPEPILNTINSTCDNVVIDVNYVLIWNATSVHSATAKVTLANIPLATTSLSTYTYSVRYTTAQLAETPSSLFATSVQLSSAAVNLTSKIDSTINLSQVMGTNVMTSSIPNQPFLRTIVTVNTSFVTRNVTATPTLVQRFNISFEHLSTVPSMSSSVFWSSSVSPGFGISRQRSGNPGYLQGRQLLGQTNDEMMTQTFSSMGLSVWKAQIDGSCSKFSKSHIPFGKDIMTGCNVRIILEQMTNCSLLRLQIMEAQQALTNAFRVAKRGNPSVLEPDDWLEVVRVNPNMTVPRIEGIGECASIPAHVQIEVLIAEAGKYSSVSQLEVSGLRIRYSLEVWKFQCSSGKVSSCIDNSTASSAFLPPHYTDFSLTSSVRFIRIPPQEPPPVKSSSNTQTVCKYDSCLKELFYPLQSIYGVSLAFLSDIVPQATMFPFGLGSFLLAMGIIVVIKRWT